MSNVKVEDIKLYPVELYSEVAFSIAYCIGATYDNAEEIANKLSICEIEDCIKLIRERMEK